MRRQRSTLMVISAWLLVAGCTTQQTKPPAPSATGNSSWREDTPSDGSRYTMEPGDTLSGGALAKQATPIYPADQLSACPPTEEVEALLIVDKTGKVNEVRVADEAKAVPSRHEFIDAVRAAALKWNFSPLKIDRWSAAPDGKGLRDIGEVLSFSRNYAFRFECHAGKAAVTSGVVASLADKHACFSQSTGSCRRSASSQSDNST
jgi:hypothetical protein